MDGQRMYCSCKNYGFYSKIFTWNPSGYVNSDGVIDIVDALLIVQFYVGLVLDNFDQNNADIVICGSKYLVGLYLIARYYLDLISKLCYNQH
jgi:hypothetical protein